MAIPIKIFDVTSKYERNMLDQFNRFQEYVESDIARMRRLHESNRLNPPEIMEFENPWWKFWRRTERIELEPTPLSETQFQALLANRRHIQKLQFACEGATEADMPFLPFLREYGYRKMVTEWNDQHFFMYRPVVEWNGATVELSHLIIGPSHLYLVEWLDGDRSIYHISKQKTWIHQPLKGENKRVVNPLIALTRTEEIIRQFLPSYDGVIQKVTVAPEGYFDHVPETRSTQFISRSDYESWLKQVNTRAPIVKAQQIRDVSKLLDATAQMPFRQFLDQ
ncbi:MULTISPECIES: NERD domain-containing protein [unclassified Exiguobacterium]|uniref:NERD domain-containing protein n=1 Tax=Exiguobacterium TaxID=33986 RepID=UPI001BEA0C52|nr:MULTISPECIES: NERD domain-containing protein [unclassified Exiguobacterium]